MGLFGGEVGGTSEVSVNSKSAAYMGDGAQGFGKLMEGIAAAYLKQVKEIRTTASKDTNTSRVTHVDDARTLERAVDDFTTVDHHMDLLTKYDEDVDRVQRRLTDEQQSILSDWIVAARDRFLSDEFKKDSAKEDVSGAINSIFDEYQKEFLPKIYSQQCKHGVYNDTTSQLLINDAYASTVIKGAKLQIDTVVAYQGIIDRFSTQIAQGLQVALGDMLHEHIDRVHEQDEDKTVHETTDRDIATDESEDRDTDTDLRETQHIDSQEDTKEDLVKSPNLKDFAKDAAIMYTASVVLRPFISRPYCEQTQEECKEEQV